MNKTECTFTIKSKWTKSVNLESSLLKKNYTKSCWNFKWTLVDAVFVAFMKTQRDKDLCDTIKTKCEVFFVF